MRSGMYKPPLGARPLRTAYAVREQGNLLRDQKEIEFTSSKVRRSSPPRVEKYFIGVKLVQQSTQVSGYLITTPQNLIVYVSLVAEFIKSTSSQLLKSVIWDRSAGTMTTCVLPSTKTLLLSGLILLTPS